MRLIDADLLKERVEKEIDIHYNTADYGIHLAEEVIEYMDLMMPTVDAKPIRHGKWLKHPLVQAGAQWHTYMMRECSACGQLVDNVTPYCPWCGAQMDGEDHV